MSTRTRLGAGMAVAAMLLLAAGTASAGTVWWTGETGTDWHVDTNWTNALGAVALPGPGTNVVIDGAPHDNQPTLNLTGGAVTIGSLTIGETAASTLTFENGDVTDKRLIVTNDLVVGAFALLEHMQNGTTANGETHRLFIEVGPNLTVEDGGAINVSAKGYNAGQGPGGSTASTTGGGHGGEGGNGGGGCYGDVKAPIQSGSGGDGGRGGGVIRLIVDGHAEIDGDLLADGGNGVGGGAGGSIFLRAGSIAGSGTIRARGGDQVNGWTGGGGGRIAIVLDEGTSFGSLDISAGRGSGGGLARHGGAGTVYRQTSSARSIIIDAAGNTLSVMAATAIPADATWSDFGSLILTNFAHLRIPATSALSVATLNAIQGDTSNARITLEGTLTTGAAISLLDCANLTLFDNGTITLSSPLTVSNFTYVAVDSGKLENFNLVVESNGIFSIVNTTESYLPLNSLTVRGGGTVRHEVESKLMLNIADHLTIDPQGAINVGGRGLGTGAPGTPSSNFSGASYGGIGGSDSEAGSAPTYGSITAPTDLGSGSGGRGAGAIILDVTSGSITNNGAVRADAISSAGGPGSGGSVYIRSKRLAGSGTISANGVGSNNGWNGSGGGRVAVILSEGTDFGGHTFTAYGGTTRRKGAAGTVYLRKAGETHGILRVDNNNQTPTYTYITSLISSQTTDTEVGTVVVQNAGRLHLGVDQALTVHGDWTNNAVFGGDAGSAIILAGVAPATLTGATTFQGLTCTVPGKTLTFQAGTTFTVAESLTLTGADGSELLLRSSNPGTQWKLTLLPGRAQLVAYVDVADSDATDGDLIVAENSIDSDNNDGWLFATAELVTWTGAVNSDWANVDNWDLGRLPTFQDYVHIPATGNDPALDSSRTLAAVTNETGSALELNGFNLTVNGSLRVAGALVVRGTETITVGGNLDFTGGTLDPAQSTVRLTGTAGQSVTSGTVQYHNLTVANGDDTVTFTDAVTAREFYCLTPGASMRFAAGTTLAVEALQLIGTAGQPIVLRSDADTASWFIDLTGWQHVIHVDVRDSHATGQTVYAIESTNSGLNDNWDFGVWHIWSGALSSVFDLDGNWAGGTAPDADSRVLIDGSGANDPRIAAGTTLRRLTIGQTAASTLIVNTNLTVTEDLLLMGHAVLTHDANSSAPLKRIAIDVGRDLAILQGASISLDGRGYSAGTGRPANHSSDGASHGGEGGADSVAGRAPTYGSIVMPDLPGSGSANPGGGVVMFSVVRAARHDGLITANGGSGGSGAGAGGAIYLATGTLIGQGILRAHGGYSTGNWNGGGGGRIAVIVRDGDDIDAVTATAHGGTTRGVGAAGTVYIRTMNDDGHGTLIVDNNGLNTVVYGSPGEPGAATLIGPLVEDAAVGNVELKNAGKLEIAANENLTVYGDWDNNGVFISAANGNVHLAGTNTVTVWNDNTWGNLTIATAGKTVAFEAGKTQTVIGTPTFDNGVILVSTQPDTQWKLIVPGTPEVEQQPVGRVSAQDSDASGGKTIMPSSGRDMGNNLNWEFLPTGSLFLLR